MMSHHNLPDADGWSETRLEGDMMFSPGGSGSNSSTSMQHVRQSCGYPPPRNMMSSTNPVSCRRSAVCHTASANPPRPLHQMQRWREDEFVLGQSRGPRETTGEFDDAAVVES